MENTFWRVELTKDLRMLACAEQMYDRAPDHAMREMMRYTIACLMRQVGEDLRFLGGLAADW